MTEMEDAYLWKKESYMGCEDTLLTVKTPEYETKANCQPSPDSSHSPPKTVVEQNSTSEMYRGDVEGMSVYFVVLVPTIRCEGFNATGKV